MHRAVLGFVVAIAIATPLGLLVEVLVFRPLERGVLRSRGLAEH